MALKGYANKLARINLSTGTVTYEPLNEDWARKYVGGRGLGVRYVLEAGPQVDPLGPNNLLAFMNGPLTGTRASMSGRLAVVTKSPLTGTVTDSHQGGWAAARLRWAGFDGLLVEGRSSKPVYLYIENGNVEIRDAGELWGKGVHATVKHFQNMYGDKDLSVIAIGPGGENLVKFAGWINEADRASGRGGTGAVGGSKLLKAIVINARKAFPKAGKPEGFDQARKDALGVITAEGAFTQPKKGGLSVYGTNVLTNITSGMGALPTRNGQVASFGDEAEFTSAEWVNANVLVDNPICHACPVACKKEVEVEYNGSKLRMESAEYESIWSFGAMSGNSNFPSIAWMIDRCNDLGIDTIEMGVTLAAYMEIHQRGHNGNVGLGWGDHARMIELIEATACREGLGNVLAEGAWGTAVHFGHPEYAMSVRKQAIPAYDPRGLKGEGLGYATSNRGACHLRAYTPASELGVISIKTDPLDWVEKPALVKLMQDLFAFTDSLDLCKFSSFVESADIYAAQYANFVGLENFTADDLLKIGERIYNLERYYNQLAGENPTEADTIPARFVNEPSTSKGSEGQVCEIREMLDSYYEKRGWDKGWVTEAKLKELEII